jgi:predicted DNA-binding transcriptional regulator AlpA
MTDAILPHQTPQPDRRACKRPRLAPFVVDATRLARLLCASVRSVRAWDSAGKLPAPIRIGGRVVWRLNEIRAWLAAGAPDRDSWAAMRDAGRR